MSTSPTAVGAASPQTAQPALPRLNGWRPLVRRLALALWRLAGGVGAPTPRAAPPAEPTLAALPRSEQQLRLAEQVAQMGSFDWDIVGNALHWSDQHYRLWGLAPGSVQPDYAVFRSGVHADDLPLLEGLLQKALAGGGSYACDHRVVWPDGTLRHIHARGEVTLDAAGRALRMIGTVQDTSERHAVQQALAVSLDNLRLTLNATGDGIFASDADSPDEPLLFVNDPLLQLWGIAPEQAVGLTPAGVIAAARRWFADPDAEVRRILEVIASGERREDRLELNDGRVLIRRCVPTVAEGRQVRVWGFRDITAQARAEQAVREAEAQQRALLEAFPGTIACLDQGLRYTHVNARMAAYAGQSADSFIGQPVRLLEGDGARLRPLVQRALEGETVSFEYLHPAAGQRTDRHLLVTVAPGTERADGTRDAYAFGTDITALKHTEAALVQARDEAERANRAKSDFLSSLSHELRTPMNAVLGFAQLLALDNGLGDHHLEQVRAIQRGGEHMLTLVNDLLDLARIEAGHAEVTLSATPLNELAAECLALVAPNAAARGIRLLVAAPEAECWVLADRLRLKQVLLNLLGNAVKYNHAGGWVRLDWLQEESHRVRLAVHDNGPGLSAAQQARLFQPFERLDAGASAVQGTGIGLALCRQLVGLMCGEIGVEGAPDEGCTFWLTLDEAPAAPTAPLANRATSGTMDGVDTAPATSAAIFPRGGAIGHAARFTPHRPAASRNEAPTMAQPDHDDGVPAHTVLYIEDNIVNAMLMGAMLDNLPGVKMLHAATPEAGLVLARQHLPALVLLDIQLPGMDGYEVLRRLRADPATAALPVVAVSANAMAQDLARGQAAGFEDYLTKPVALDTLVNTVASYLQPHTVAA